MKPRAWRLGWWLNQDARLAIRQLELALGWSGQALGLGLFAGVFLLAHSVAWVALAVLERSDRAFWPHLQGLLLLAVLFTTFVRATKYSHDVLYGRRDRTLLLLAPVPMQVVLRARVLMIALYSAAFPLLFLLPVADAAALLHGPAELAFYPVALSLTLLSALLATTVSTLARRWRWGVNPVVAMRVVFALCLVMAALSRQPALAAPLARTGAAIERSLDWWGSSLAGRPLPLALLVAMGVAGGLLLPVAFRGAFLESLRDAPVAGRTDGAARQRRVLPSGLAGRFVAKDMKLLFRQPAAVVELLLSVVLGAAVALLVSATHRFATAQVLAAAVVFATGTFTLDVGWRMLANEPSSALLWTAPLTRRRLLGLKALSAAALVVPVFIVALAVAWRCVPSAGLAIAVAGPGVILTALLLGAGVPQPGRPDTRAFLDDRKHPLMIAAQVLCTGMWAIAAAAVFPRWAGVALGGLAMLLAFCVRAGRFWLHGPRGAFRGKLDAAREAP